MKYNKLEYFASKPRLERFLASSGDSKIKSQVLYRTNLRVCQAFYPILNLFEIFLRNVMNYVISDYFNDPNWITHIKNGFMNDPSLHGTRFYLRNAVAKAEATIIRKGGIVTSGKIIAEQSFGFWTSLFDVHHFRLLGGSVIHSFPDKPAPINRSIIAQKLTRIRGLRNRIYHNEPICFAGKMISFNHIKEVRREIYEMLAWMDPSLPGYVKSFDNINSKII